MDYTNLCLGCIEDKGTSQTCPHCGCEEGTAPESLLHLPAGTVLQDKYLLGRVLGQGGFGITYIAWDKILKIKLAIKEYLPQQLVTRTGGSNNVTVYKASLSEDFKYGLTRFLEEAQTLARFNEHPNIVTVRDYFEANNTAYLVMNYHEGVTLQNYLADKGGIIPVEQALEIFMPVLDALREVHNVGILHRDISPDNLLIDKNGRVILIDFGAARQAMGEKSKSLSVIMKAGYSPEEQYRSRGEQGPWTDIYAVAATMYYAISGVMPPESLDRMSEDTLNPPSQLGVKIKLHLEQALLKAMALRSKDRYQTVEAFQEDLLGKEPIGDKESPEVVKEEADKPGKPQRESEKGSAIRGKIENGNDDLFTDDGKERLGSSYDYQKAGIWKRIGAFFLDVIIVSQIPLFAVMSITYLLLHHADMNLSFSYAYFYGLVIIPYAWMFFYILLRDGFSNGQSWGKRFFKIMVVRLKDNKPCTIGNSIARNCLFLILSLIEIITPLFHHKGQRLGDMIAKTQVIDVDDYKGFRPTVNLLKNRRTPSLNEVKYIAIVAIIGFILFSGLRFVIGSAEPSFDYSKDYGVATFTIGTTTTGEDPDIILSDSSYWEDVNYIDWIRVECHQHELARILVEDVEGQMKEIPVIPNGMPLYHIFFAENYYALRDITLPDPFKVKIYVQKDGKSLQGERTIEVRIHNYLDSYPGETDLAAVGQTTEVDVVFYSEREGYDSSPDYSLIESALYRLADNDNLVLTRHDIAQNKNFRLDDPDRINVIYRYEKVQADKVFVEVGPPHSEYSDYGYLKWVDGEWVKVND